MDACVLVGTTNGLWQVGAGTLQRVDSFPARPVTAVAQHGAETWAVVDGRALWHTAGDGRWREQTIIEGHPVSCLAYTPEGLLLGTEQAHLVRWIDGRLERVEPFESVPGRAQRYTPWGDPADVRSIAVAPDGTWYVNVHVGGVVRSRDWGESWTPTIDIDADVHQVLTHPTQRGVVLVAAATGLGVSRDGGDSWTFTTSGMHAHYARAVAISGDHVLISVATGPHGRRAALYRTQLEHLAFERCAEGVPWLEHNIDTACLGAHEMHVAFGTDDGRVFQSTDGGSRWEHVDTQLPPITAVAVGASSSV